MDTRISVHDKKQFLRWFLSNYQLKNRECVWILNYLINHESILQYVHFVRNIKGCPRGLVITAQCSEEASFRFYKNQILTTDAEKSFHDIRMNRLEPVYIQLNFASSWQSPHYAAVMEENPYVNSNAQLTTGELQSVQYMLDSTLYQTQKALLQSEIDEALDKRDYETFKQYAVQLQALEEEYISNRKKADSQG